MIAFLSTPFPSPRRRCAKVTVASCSSSNQKQEIARKLAADLPTQYAAPRRMDWSIYSTSVTFDDPLTKLSGILLYKGMIFTLAIIVRLCFEGGSAAFHLKSCELMEEEEEEDKIRTEFATSGRTRWGSQVLITGTDYFWVACQPSGDVRIVRHQSTWDQTSKEILDAFTGAS